jgi:lipid-A-disaccharide synthase-like uncharacterized protein
VTRFALSIWAGAGLSCGIMDWLTNLVWHNGKFFGIDWGVWKVVGWLANAIFSSRFLVQWYVTEKRKQVVVPQAFWWLSLIGSLTFLCYSIHQRDSVFIFAYAFTWIPYIRNLVIHRRHKEAHTDCAGCGKSCPPLSNFCPNCGAKLTATS